MRIQIYACCDCSCSYSAKKEFGIFDPEVIIVHDHEKDHYKQINQMETFPQIFFIINDKRIKVGGYDDTKSLIDKIRNRENINIDGINSLDEYEIINFFNEKLANEMLLHDEFREKVYNDQIPWLSKNGI